MTTGRDMKVHHIYCKRCGWEIKRLGRNQKFCYKCSKINKKEYVNKYNKMYRATDKYRNYNRLYKRQMRAKHPLREKKKQHDYYIKNRDRILARIAERAKGVGNES